MSPYYTRRGIKQRFHLGLGSLPVLFLVKRKRKKTKRQAWQVPQHVNSQVRTEVLYAFLFKGNHFCNVQCVFGL